MHSIVHQCFIMIAIYCQQKVCWAEVEKAPSLPSQLLQNMKHIKGFKGLIDICFLSIWSRVKDQLTLSLPCKSRHVFNFSNSSKVPGSLTVPLWPRSMIDKLKSDSWTVYYKTTFIHTHIHAGTHMHACTDIF